MSTLLVLCALTLAGFMIFSLCSNIIYWYENLNMRDDRLRLPSPGILTCLFKYMTSLGGYVLCVVLFPFGPFLRRAPSLPGSAAAKEAPLVVLVHGLNNNAAAWLYIARRLTAAGCIVSTYTYSSLFVPLQSIVDGLEKHVRQLEAVPGAGKPVLVGHSLGGILIREWLRRPGNHARASGVVTLGTPHTGSKLAVFAPGALAKNLKPGSPLLQELEASSPPPLPCVSIVSTFDEAVLPSFRLLPPEGWKLRISAPLGHFSMLFSASTANILIEEIEAMPEAAD